MSDKNAWEIWRQIIDRTHLVGGLIVHNGQAGTLGQPGMYRGLIESIGIEDKQLVVTTERTTYVKTNVHAQPIGDERIVTLRRFTYDLGWAGEGFRTSLPVVSEERIIFGTPTCHVTLFPASGKR